MIGVESLYVHEATCCGICVVLACVCVRGLTHLVGLSGYLPFYRCAVCYVIRQRPQVMYR